jgi:hypothetical protein
MSVVLVALVAGGATIASAGSGSASAPITKKQAVAFARAVNLTASDLPGAKKVEPPSYEVKQDEKEAAASFLKTMRCARPGIVTHRPVYVESSGLVDTPWDVASSVRVMPTEAIAAAQVAAFASKRGHVCFARADQIVVSSANEPPEGPEPIKATFIPLVKLLGVGAIGVHTLSRTVYPATRLHPRTSVLLYSDSVLFRVGPAEIALSAVGKTQFPAATERRLLALLHSRAKAHPL